MYKSLHVTKEHITLPNKIPYDIIAGGACRDAMVGGSENIMDYDVYYTSPLQYMEATKRLFNSGLHRSENYTDTIGGRKCHIQRFKGGRFSLKKKPEYDLFLFNCKLPELISIINNTFDFTVNTCYQPFNGTIRMRTYVKRHLEDKRLEINDFNMQLPRVINRAIYFKKKDWEIGNSVVKDIIEGIVVLKEHSMSDLQKIEYNNGYKRYIYSESGHYCTFHYVYDKRIWRDVFPITSDECLLIGLQHENSYIRRKFLEEYRKRQRWGHRLSNVVYPYIGDIFNEYKVNKNG